MRKLIASLALIGILFGTSACTRHTPYGQCVGLINKDDERSNLRYEVSTWNIVMAAIFSETLLWPGLTAAFWVWCPQGTKDK